MRDRLRRLGLRPVQYWVPDTRSSRFADEAHAQSLSVARSPHEAADQEFVEAISEFDAE
jgi:hypothetical protein